MEIDPQDYIRKVQISEDSHYALYEEYKRLYEEGYHFIISLHLNRNLKKHIMQHYQLKNILMIKKLMI